MESANPILVSICCITYNHFDYIRECLDGLLMQKCNFGYEIIINDDCSTDGTTEIIKNYASKYPDIIKTIYHDENQYQKGVRGMFPTFCFPLAKGKYVALCEGDDYWTDPYKLQKQVDFLELNSDYSMCFHNAVEHWEDGRMEDKLFSNVEDREYNGEEIFTKWTVPTASVLCRREILESELYKKVCQNKKFIYIDIVLFLTCAHYGKLRGMSDVMSVYRKQPGGVVYNYDAERQKKQAYHELEIYKIFGDRYKVMSIQRFSKSAMESFWGLKAKGKIDWKLLLNVTIYSPSTLLHEIRKRFKG